MLARMVDATPQVMTIPFVHRGSRGTVRVEYGINEDPERLGYGESVLGAGSPPEMARGFPVVQASVAYEGLGYGAQFGWLQIVRYRIDDTGEEQTVLDVPPQLSESDCPYCAFGIRPTMFDAPGMAGVNDATWHADTLLVHTPNAVLSKDIRAICGFTWGFLVARSKATPSPLAAATEADWERDVVALRRDYPRWHFASSWGAEGSSIT
jgi:hypothetical protein